MQPLHSSYTNKNLTLSQGFVVCILSVILSKFLTCQVFGGLLMSPAEEGEDETDAGASPEGEKEGEVREHAVDILFSKDKLSGLQKQVRISIFTSPMQ